MSDKERVEAARAFMAIANDADRSAVERIVAFEMACDQVYQAAETTEEVDEIIGAIGIGKMSIGLWAMTEALSHMCACNPREADVMVRNRARGVIMALFPDIAMRGGVMPRERQRC